MMILQNHLPSPTKEKKKQSKKVTMLILCDLTYHFSDTADQQHLHAGHQSHITPTSVTVWWGYNCATPTTDC